MHFYELSHIKHKHSSVFFLAGDVSCLRLTGDFSHISQNWTFPARAHPLKWLLFRFSLQSLTDAGAAFFYTMKHYNRKYISLKNKQKLSPKVQNL